MTGPEATEQASIPGAQLRRVRVSATDPEDRGRQLGLLLRDEIHETLSAYAETFAYHTGLTWERVVEVAKPFEDSIERYDHAVLQEIAGMAAGSGTNLLDLVAVNARSEIMFGLDIPPMPECTAFFCDSSATASGDVLLGQNWDWRPRAVRNTVLLELEQGLSASSIFMAPEAGMVGKMGFNDTGLGVVLNALVSDLDQGSAGVPVHVILRAILNSGTVEEAVDHVARAFRGGSATFTVASASGEALALEAGPGGVDRVYAVHPSVGTLVHTNHFVSRDFDHRDLGRQRWPDSLTRMAAISRFMDRAYGHISEQALEGVLTDTSEGPGSVCQSPDPELHSVEQTSTVLSIIMNLTQRRAYVSSLSATEPSYVEYVPYFARSSAV